MWYDGTLIGKRDSNLNKIDIETLYDLRRRMFVTSIKHGTTHLASAFSCLEIIYSLYEKNVLKLGSINDESRDRFILSKGHAAIGLYAVLEHMSLINAGEMDTFLEPLTRLAGEPCKRDLPIIEASTGSLGHGLSIGLGIALGQKKRGHCARTFVLLGDGECQEGSVWEAAMGAARYSVDNLIAILDCNELQKMQSVFETMKTIDWSNKWSSFGWDVVDVDGHNVDELTNVLNRDNHTGKPRIVVAHTIKGKGVTVMENSAMWHFKEPKKKELKAICDELKINIEELL